MSRMILGKTGLEIEKNGFGCLPIQRIDREAAARLLHRAADGGMNYFDTARAYSDSEEKLGYAFRGMRHQVIIASKTMAKTGQQLKEQLETSLKNLGTDYIDVYQFHNPAFCPRPGGEDGLYDAALEAQAQGKIRFIAITNHRLSVAKEAIESGLYALLQFPYSYLSGPQDEQLLEQCRNAGMGFVAMKAMAGGLLQNGLAAAAFMETKPDVVPIWGVQHDWELEQFLSGVQQPLTMTEEYRSVIEKDREELAGDFCRGCGYCMPCPAGIEINNCARMSLLLRRAPTQAWLTQEQQEKMRKIQDCLHCGKCSSRCPYGLDTPRLLEENWKDYQNFLK